MDLKKVFYLLLVFLAALFGTGVGFAAGAFVVYRYEQGNSLAESTDQNLPVSSLDENVQQNQETETSALLFSSTDIETTITQAVEKAGPAVVTVVGIIPGYSTWLYQYSDQQSSGSGMIISEDGYILTNNHVVEDMSEISVILADGSELPAVVVSTDIFADLAVLKAEGDMPAVAVLGDSDNLKPGETVIAIGSPLGSFKNSVTVGVISATGRSLDTGSGYQMEDMLQTDASINPGNSGGPLVNLAGEVIGVNTLVVRQSSGTIAEGLGFAVPSNLAGIIAQQIITEGYFARPNLGIRWQAITPAISARYHLPVEWGAYVIEVQCGGPADLAGIEAQDIITCIGGNCIDDEHSYYNVLFENQAGDHVNVTLTRNNGNIEVEVTLGQGAGS